MKNSIQKGVYVSAVAPYAVIAGAVAKVGGIFGVVVDDAASGEQMVVRRDGTS